MSKRQYRLFVICLIVVVITRCVVWFTEAFTPPACLQQTDHRVVVVIESVKNTSTQIRQIDGAVDAVQSSTCLILLGQRLRLSWYYPKISAPVGTRMWLTVRLREPWGARNPGGFDYGVWLVGRGYVASGYVRAVTHYESPQPTSVPLIDPQTYVHANLLNALLLGNRDGVSARQWALFRDTGTIHLMVVSGLHVGIFITFLYGCGLAFFRSLPLRHPSWVPHRAALLFSLFSIVVLIHQIGAQPPVLRAGLMAGTVALTIMLLRRVSVWHCFWLSIGVILLIYPRVLLLHGFWLSYAAVGGLLVFFAPRQPSYTWVRGLFICQLVLLVFLAPWLGVTVGEMPLIGPVANVLVVPVVTLVTLPLGLLGILLNPIPGVSAIAEGLLWVADYSLALVIEVLTPLQGAWSSLGYFDAQTALIVALCGLVMLIPVSRSLKGLALCGWLAVLAPVSAGVAPGEFRVSVLDVGQGSAAIIDTYRHRIIVDAGPRFASGFDSGEAVVIPGLRATGPDRVDYILLSHGDNDHAGGLESLRVRYPHATVVGDKQPCRRNKTWQWEGVTFSILVDVLGRNNNDRSCTLLVTSKNAKAYFSGDISRNVEARLLTHLPTQIDFLIAPHHGSATSSSARFVRTLCPRFVVFSAGRNNRYGHPKPVVVERYNSIGAKLLNTGLDGAIQWYSQHPQQVSSLRRGSMGSTSPSGFCQQP